MAEKFREHVCPNCGAPLGIPEKHDRFFKCQFCGTILEDQATKEEQQTGVFKIKISQQDVASMRSAQVPVYTAPPVRQAPAQPARVTVNTGNKIGCIITISVILLVGGILAVSLLPALLASGVFGEVLGGTGIEEVIDPSGLGGLDLYSYGAKTILPSDNDTSPDFAGIAVGPDSFYYLTYVDFENTPPLRWKAEFTDQDVFWVYNRILADDTRVYISYEKTLIAFNRAQGTEIWESNTADAIQHNICPGCFQQIGDHLATLSADGTLQVWDAASGSMSWQVRMEATPRQIINFGGNPAVLDEIDDTVRLRVYNVADGEVNREIFLSCPSTPFPTSPQEVGIYDYLVPLGNGDGFVFFGGFFEPGCVQRWAPGSDGPLWSTEFNDPFNGLQPEDILVTPETVYVGSGNGAYAVDLATGSFSVLIDDDDFTFIPLGSRDGVILLAAESYRGTRHWEIWGLDAALGNVKWTYTPDAKTYFDPDSFGSLSSDGNWSAGFTADGLTVAQFFEEPLRLSLQTLSVQSGTASPALTVPLDEGQDFSSPGISVLGWRNNNLWFMSDLNRPSIRVIDATTGSPVSTWP